MRFALVVGGDPEHKRNNIMKIEVVSIKENSDGSADLSIEIDDEYRNHIKSMMGWKRWSNKKFAKYFLDLIKRQISLEENS